MRLASAAFLSLLAAAPALAAGSSSLHVGLVITGNLSSPLAGTWDSRAAARGAIYRFVVGGTSGVFYELVSVPLPGDGLGAAPAAGQCELRVSGVIESLQEAAGTMDRASAPSYEMRYSIQSAEVVTSSTNIGECRPVAASYVSDTPAADATQSLLLSRAGEGSLIDSATGTQYVRTR